MDAARTERFDEPENRSIRVPEERMRFMALHLHDLQSLRWMPLLLAGIAMPFLAGRVSFDTAACVTGALLLATVPWFIWFRAHVRRTYGESNLTGKQKQLNIWSDNWFKRVLFFLVLTLSVWDLIAYTYLHLKVSWPMVVSAAQSISLFSYVMTDRTNLLERRIVRGIVVFSLIGMLLFVQICGLFRMDTRGVTLWLFAAVGTLLLTSAVYDYSLLKRCAKASREAIA